MEFIVPKRDFVKGLARVQNIADKRSAMPILSNVLITSDGKGTLRLAATDLLLSVACTVNADVRKGGTVALPARSLFDMVKALPEGDVTITVGTNYGARVAGGRRRFELVGMPGEDFPQLPSPDKAELRDLPVEALAELISLSSFSMSSDDTRPHLAGALLESDSKGLRMVTTDGHRLSKAERPMNAEGAAVQSLLIPSKGVHELRRLLDEVKAENKSSDAGTGTIAIGKGGANLFIKRDGTTLAVKLVEAQFPAYQQVIPSSVERVAKMPRTGMLDALRAVSLVSADRSSGVKLQFTNGKVVITSENPDVGAGTDELEVDYAGGELTVGFNSRYLIEALSALSSEDVKLEMSGELDPGMVKPATPTAGGTDFVGVIMPMRI